VYGKDNRPSTVYKLPRQLITSENYSDSDKDIITILYTRGQFQYGKLGDAPGAVGAIVDGALLRKFGARVGPQQSVFNIITPEALREYGRAIMDKNNANRLTGTIQMKGDARLDVGNYCYIKWRTTCYYISQVTHSYNVGSGYDMTLNLQYGRRPIAFTATRAKVESDIAKGQGLRDLSVILQKYAFSNVLINLINSQSLDPITLLPTDGKTEAERLRDGASAALVISEADARDLILQQSAGTITGDNLDSAAKDLVADLKTTQKGTRLILDGFVWSDLTSLIYDRAAKTQADILSAESDKISANRTDLGTDKTTGLPISK
jgi:hypothetical protein